MIEGRVSLLLECMADQTLLPLIDLTKAEIQELALEAEQVDG